MAALRIVPIGLAIPRPAMSGADPWIGSYKPDVGLNEGEEGTEGAPASDAEGRRPSEPGITLDSSERLAAKTQVQNSAGVREIMKLTYHRTDFQLR